MLNILGYQCKCNQGFKDISPGEPGRLCQQMVNECSRPDLNSCDKNARCEDLENGYKCECNPNFLDVSPSPTLPGRACKPSKKRLFLASFKVTLILSCEWVRWSKNERLRQENCSLHRHHRFVHVRMSIQLKRRVTEHCFLSGTGLLGLRERVPHWKTRLRPRQRNLSRQRAKF